MAFAEKTRVPVAQTKQEIERMCQKHGCSKFGSAADYDGGHAQIQFHAHNRIIRFELELPKRKDYGRGEQWEQATRAKWRALLLVLKAKLESIEAGIGTFESEFMPFIVMPNDKTVGEILTPMIDAAYQDGNMPRALIDLK